jgi:hypothetical protein
MTTTTNEPPGPEPTLSDVLARLDRFERHTDDRFVAIDQRFDLMITTLQLIVDRIQQMEGSVRSLIDAVAAHIREHDGDQ